LTLANKITLLRIVLIPIFIVGLVENAAFWPLAVFVFCTLTDVMDGAVARSRNQRTVLGTFLDPVADKLLLNATFLVLAFRGRVPAWMFVVVFSRDLLILLGWNIIFVLTRNSTVEPRWPGKSTTLAQMLAVIAVLSPVLAPVQGFFMGVMTLLTAVSTVDYVWVGGRKLNQLG
jgi:cardiolipin synthase